MSLDVTEPNLFLDWNFRDSVTYPSGTDFCDMDDGGTTVVIEPTDAPWNSSANKTYVEDNWDTLSNKLDTGTGTNGTTSTCHVKPYGEGDVPVWSLENGDLNARFDGVRVWCWGSTDLGQPSDSYAWNFGYDDDGTKEAAVHIDRNDGSTWKAKCGTTYVAPTTNMNAGPFKFLADVDLAAGTGTFYLDASTASADWSMPTANKKVSFSDSDFLKTTEDADTINLHGLVHFVGSAASGTRQTAYYLAVEFRAIGASYQYLTGTADPPDAVNP